MHRLTSILLSFIFIAYSVTAFAASETETYPKRKFYPQLNYISTQTLFKGLEKKRYDVIDVRGKTAYQALHVKNSVNIPVNSKTFDKEILEFIKQSKKPLAIYCNGISCSKSYIASAKTIEIIEKHNLNKKVYTYDSGINAIAFAHNNWVLKNGEEISATNPLTDPETISKHNLAPGMFEQMLLDKSSKEVALLDIRFQKEKIIHKLFMLQKQTNITLNQRDKLIAFLNKVKKDKKTLLVYDSSGRQINSLYELIKIIEIEDWHFMKGGEFGYSKYAIQSAGI
jgi:rhodanese-related sulfurtransferase